MGWRGSWCGCHSSGASASSHYGVHQNLKDNPDLPEGERSARVAGRVGAGVGGAAGVARAGTTLLGLSGASMAMEMAALGSVVGGGMATGAAMLVAAPAIVAVATAAGAYGLAKANEAHTEAAQHAKAHMCTLTTPQVLKVISTDKQVLGELLEMLGDGLPYIEMPTLGGHVF